MRIGSIVVLSILNLVKVKYLGILKILSLTKVKHVGIIRYPQGPFFEYVNAVLTSSLSINLRQDGIIT